jgi:hypothetical protein
MNVKQVAIDYIDTPSGKIPIVPSSLNIRDKLGDWKVRWKIGRMNYTIEPGLYAIGNPDAGSPVLVSANYKLSFDSLRKELQELNAWILVLDTDGINVWCAAGKGTFGTDELINRIHETNLAKIVSHHQLILPQLGAPGIAAHLVREATGFKVTYGPIRSNDLINFLNSRLTATDEMRLVRFNMIDRLKVVPVELVQGLKYAFLLSAILFVLSGLNRSGFAFNQMIGSGMLSIVCIFLAFFSGVILTPLLLPFIPGRAFALKGAVIVIPIVILLNLFLAIFQTLHLIEKIACLLIMLSISSFFAMNFTGASTYTSLSGVKKEMRIAVPLQIFGFVSGLILWIISRFI